MRKCARALIFDENQRLLVFERRRQKGLFGTHHHYYSVPGGGIEENETPEQAAVRELREEMRVDIAVERFLAHQVDELDQREHYYYLARIVAGTPTFNIESEEAAKEPRFGKNSYAVAWAPLDEPLLGYHPAYGQIASLLRDWLSSGFPTEPVDIRLENR